MRSENIGSTFDSWLREEGVYDETASSALARVLARQMESAMELQDPGKSGMTRRGQASRAPVERPERER